MRGKGQGRLLPPWMKSSSGGPSSLSSSHCSAPIFFKSQMLTRRSEEAEAKTVEEKGAHSTQKTSSTCVSKVCSLPSSFRISHIATVCGA